jgi:hypothetical protein
MKIFASLFYTVAFILGFLATFGIINSGFAGLAMGSFVVLAYEQVKSF